MTKPFFLSLCLLFAFNLKSQDSYWIFSGRDYELPESKLAIGLSFRSLNSKDPVPDFEGEHIHPKLVEEILNRGVVAPDPVIQIALRIQGWQTTDVMAGVEFYFNVNKDRSYFSESKELEVVYPARRELQEAGLRLNLQTLTKIGGIHFKPTLCAGLSVRSEGYNFYILGEPEYEGLPAKISVDPQGGLLNFKLFNQLFAGVGFETLLLAIPGETFTHSLNLELMVQRNFHVAVPHSISYEDSLISDQYGRIEGGGWWTFTIGLGYSFF